MDVIFVYYFNLYLLLCIILNLKKNPFSWQLKASTFLAIINRLRMREKAHTLFLNNFSRCSISWWQQVTTDRTLKGIGLFLNNQLR